MTATTIAPEATGPSSGTTRRRRRPDPTSGQKRLLGLFVGLFLLQVAATALFVLGG